MTGILFFNRECSYYNSHIGTRCTNDGCYLAIGRLHVCGKDISSRDKTVANRYMNRVSVQYLRAALSDAHPPRINNAWRDMRSRRAGGIKCITIAILLPLALMSDKPCSRLRIISSEIINTHGSYKCGKCK